MAVRIPDWRCKLTAAQVIADPLAFPGVELPNHAIDLYSKGCPSLSAYDFYEMLFDDSFIEERGDLKKRAYSPKILVLSKKKKDEWSDAEKQLYDDWVGAKKAGVPAGKNPASSFRKARLKTIFQGHQEIYDEINSCKKTSFLVIRPVAYAGRSIQDKNARLLYALVIEIDDLKSDEYQGISSGIQELFYMWDGRKEQRLPRPTAIVCSGSGVHLYFMFEKPVMAYPSVINELTTMKRWLTKQYWCRSTSTSKVQFEAVTQGFRVVGSPAKNSKRLVMAFETGDKVSIEYLNEFVPEDCRVSAIYKRTGLTRAEAKEKYPEWYEERIVQGKPKKVWTYNHRRLYDWWLREIGPQIQEGWRGKYLENLASLARKCGISREELLQDMESERARLDRLTKRPDNDFTQADIDACMRTYDLNRKNAYARRVDYLRNHFEGCITIPETTRNGRSQEEHLQAKTWVNAKGRPTVNVCKQNREFALQYMRENGEITGRPKGSSQERIIVKEWRQKNPNGRKCDCIRDTKLSKPTVYRWWDDDEK